MVTKGYSERDLGFRADTTIASVGLLVAVLLFPLRFFVSQVLIHTVPIVLGVGSGLYLVIERYDRVGTTAERWRLGSRAATAARLFVLVGLGALILVGAYTGGRTVPFFALAGLVGAAVFGQIFFLRRTALRPMAVLAQLVAFALVVRGVALVTTPGYVGVDSWVHLPDYAASIRETGQLSAIADSKYFGAPIYHLFVVTAAEAFNSSLQTALYATLGIVMPLSLLLVYYTAGYFLSVRWALFAAAAFSVADHVVRWGIHIIPTSLGLVFFAGVVYCVTRIYITRGTPAMYALTLGFILATIHTHQLSTFIVLLFLGAGAAVQVYRALAPRLPVLTSRVNDNSVNFVGLLAVALPITVVNWHVLLPGETSFLEGMLANAAEAIETAGFLSLASASSVENEAIQSMAVSVPMPVQILNYLGFLVLLFVTLVGTYTLMRYQERQLLSLTWISAMTLLLFVTLGMPLFGLYFLIPGRWYAFLYVLMVLVGAYGLEHFDRNMPVRQLVVVLVLVALLLPGAMLVNNKATHDNPVADDYYHRFAYTESELGAADTIDAIHPDGTTLETDNPYYLFLRDAKGMSVSSLELTDEGAVSGDYVVYREYQTDAGPQVRYGGENVRVQLQQNQVCRPSMHVVYSNGDVQYCQSSS